MPRISKWPEDRCGTHKRNRATLKMSTTLEIHTLPIPAQQRAAVEKTGVLEGKRWGNGSNRGGDLPPVSRQMK